MQFIAAVVLGLCCCLLALADEEFSIPEDISLTGPNVVVDLSKENFTQFLDAHPVVLAEFYAPWCHHCKQLAPHYEEAARLMKDAENPVAFAKIDATVEQSLAQEYSIEGYPTLKIFHRNSPKPYDYDGPRGSSSLIVDYMKDFAKPDWTPPPSDVVILTAENFTTFVNNEQLTLVEFYAPWCGYCKQLEPKYEKAASQLKKEANIRLAKVDAAVEMKLAVENNVTGYPTLFVFRQGGKRSEYDGEQSEHGIVSHMKELLSSPSREIRTVNDYKSLFMTNDRPVIMGLFQSEQDPLYQSFIDYAYSKRKAYRFGHTFQTIATLNDVQAPAVILQHHSDVRSKFEKEKYVLTKTDASESDIRNFVEQHHIPLVGVLTKENQRTIYLNRRPICVVIYDLDFTFEYREKTQYWRNKLVKIANDYRGKYTFAIADETEMASLLKDFGLDESGEDVNVGCYDKDGLKYRMDDDDEFTSESFAEFINRLTKGKIKPYFKSQTIPKNALVNGVLNIVGKNFANTVFDKTKNVLVFFYAPWCGHCTTFKPNYVKLAQRYTGRSNLVFAQIDAAANDIPRDFNVTGFPTLFLVPTDNKPVRYEGNREIDDLVSFIDKNLASKSEL